MWHIINHWTLDVLHSSSNFHTSMHLTEHLSLITSIMVAVGGNQRTNVTWKKVLPLTHAALYSSLAHLEPLATSLCTLSKLHFFQPYPSFSSLWTFCLHVFLQADFCSLADVHSSLHFAHAGRGLIAEQGG